MIIFIYYYCYEEKINLCALFSIFTEGKLILFIIIIVVFVVLLPSQAMLFLIWEKMALYVVWSDIFENLARNLNNRTLVWVSLILNVWGGSMAFSITVCISKSIIIISKKENTYFSTSERYVLYIYIYIFIRKLAAETIFATFVRSMYSPRESHHYSTRHSRRGGIYIHDTGDFRNR